MHCKQARPPRGGRLRRRCRERGMALVLSLFIVVLVTAIVVSVSWRFQLGMARNENRWHGAQARAYLEGGEQLARKVLIDDALESQNDHLREIWAQSGDPLPTDEGWIRGRLEDAHSRFNLNLLIAPVVDPTKPPPLPEDKYSAMQRRFIRFLQMIELEDGFLDLAEAIAIVDAIQDWLDPDSNPFGFNGAERSHYDSLDPPVMIANGPMQSVSELLLVKGMTPELYEKLVPYIIALDESVKMNINTVTPEILRAFNRKELLEPLNESEWQALVEERNLPELGFNEVKDFANSPVVQAILGDNKQFDTANLTTASSYFLFFGETLVGEQVRRSKSLLVRARGQVEVVRRTDANF